MKHQLLTVLIASGCLALASCSDDFGTQDGRTGRISPLVDLNTQVVTSKSVSARSASAVSVDELSLKLVDPDGVVRTWDNIASFPVDQEFKVGTYTLEATYGTADDEGFEKPYYYGTTQFEVKENQTVTPSLTAALANAMVSVDYTDAFKGYFKAYTTTLQSVGGQPVVYEQAEGRPGHLKAGSVTIQVDVTKQDGTTYTLSPQGFTAEARHHYHLTLDVNEGNVNNAAIVLTFDDLLAQEDVVIDLSDQINAASAPYIVTTGFNTGDVISGLAGEPAAEPLKLTVMARAGLSSVALSTVSPSLVEQGWPANVDLMTANAATFAKLKNLGLQTIGFERNPDKMVEIDLTNVIQHIGYLEGTSNSNVFTLTVKDIFAREEVAQLTINIEKLSVALSAPAAIVNGQDTFDVDVMYNGADAANDVQIQYKNDRGTWSDATINSVNAVTSRAMNHYLFNITVPLTTGVLELRAVCGSLKSEEVSVTHVDAPFELTYNANDVFATHALVSVISKTSADVAEVASTGRMIVTSANGGATPQVAHKGNGVLALSGLTPGKTYTLKFANDSFTTVPITISTEAATQLPNGSMEEWTRVDGKTNYWWVEYPGESTSTPWGTMNLLTTSEGGSGTNMFTHDGCSYNAYSGTRETSDAKSGKAAIIETVGWGKGNSALGNSSKVENVTVGQLYLGTYDASNKAPNYGYAFASRPSSMTFWYKYRAKNSADYGYAEITVLASDGTVLASATKQITAQDTYKEATLPLTYAAGAKKAASIKVIFKSSDNDACINSNKENMDHPAAANLSDGRNVGSSLYIDEIVLNY